MQIKRLIAICVTLVLLWGSVGSASYTVTSSQSILFNGDPTTWKTLLANNQPAMREGVLLAIQSLLYRPNVTITVPTVAFKIHKADRDLKSLGDGSGGLLAYVVISSEVVSATHAYDKEEINSLLYDLSVDALTTLYGSTVTVQVVRQNIDYKFRCTWFCKWMIIVGCVFGVLALALISYLVFYSCCGTPKRKNQ